MRLIGMLDSPYVRRVAISLNLLDIPFIHEPLSVFSQYEAFATINPVVKAPTLITDDCVVLMESTLILGAVEVLAPPERRLMPKSGAALVSAQRITGLALAACEKAVQIVYELNLRPPEKRHAPWVDRVRRQMREAWRLLETEVPATGWAVAKSPMAPDIAAAVAWTFARHLLPEETSDADHPRLSAFTARAEALAAFKAAPHDG